MSSTIVVSSTGRLREYGRLQGPTAYELVRTHVRNLPNGLDGDYERAGLTNGVVLKHF